MEQSTGRAFSGFSGWQGKQILDTSVFDYWNNDVAGPNNTTWHDFETLNFNATQTYLNGRAGIELVYDKQEYEDGFNRYLITPNRIGIDINPSLRQEVNADGTLRPAAPNPNFGRPFAFSADANTSGTEARRNVEMRENYRMTAFYKLDLEKMLDSRNLADAHYRRADLYRSCFATTLPPLQRGLAALQRRRGLRCLRLGRRHLRRCIT